MAQKITKKSQLALLKSIRSMLLQIPSDGLHPQELKIWQRLAILSLHPDLGSESIQPCIVNLYNFVNHLYLKV